MISGKDFFYCYNKKLTQHLSDRGFKYITIAINPNTNKMYTMFLKSNQLQQAIDEYKHSK